MSSPSAERTNQAAYDEIQMILKALPDEDALLTNRCRKCLDYDPSGCPLHLARRGELDLNDLNAIVRVHGDLATGAVDRRPASCWWLRGTNVRSRTAGRLDLSFTLPPPPWINRERVARHSTSRDQIECDSPTKAITEVHRWRRQMPRRGDARCGPLPLLLPLPW